MMRATGLILMLGLTALGCAAGDPVDEEWSSSESGKADGLRESGTVFFVYDNHRVCVTAPCPMYTVITPGGVRFDVARLLTDDTVEARSALPYAADGGVLVNGAYVRGSWKQGRPGPAIRIETPIDPAQAYLVHRHASDAGAPYAVVTANEINHDVDRIDLEGYLPADIECEQNLATLEDGEWATRGFLARSDTGETTLFATTGVADSMTYAVRPSGIECVTWPCPEWSVESPDGVFLGYASRLELAYLHISDKDAAALEAKLRASGGSVYAWLAEDDWNPGADEVVVVVDLVGIGLE